MTALGFKPDNFEEDIEFYWSRSRILEKLNSLPSGLLPEGVNPALGPDATGLGQIFWYTLEGRDENGNVTDPNHCLIVETGITKYSRLLCKICSIFCKWCFRGCFYWWLCSRISSGRKSRTNASV